MHHTSKKNDLFEPEIRAWLGQHATFGRAFERDALAQTLSAHGLPCPPTLVEWERTLDELRPAAPGTEPPLLSLHGLRFGTVAELEVRAAGEWPPDATERSRATIPIGSWRHGALGLGADGGLYAHIGHESWRCLAAHPAIFLRRVAAQARASAEGLVHVVAHGRASADRVARFLSLKLDAAQTDRCLRWWGERGLFVVEGDVASPDAMVSQAFATREFTPRMVDAFAALGLKGEVKSTSAATRLARPTATSVPPAPRRSFQHQPVAGQGDGWVGLVEERPAPVVLRQVCSVGGRLVAESDWPSGTGVEYIRAEMPSLSPAGQRRLAMLGFRRDPRLSCAPEKLRLQLAQMGLPSYPIVLELERTLGGLWLPLRGGGSRLGFGTYSTLLYDQTYSDARILSQSSESLERSEEWPRVFFQGSPLTIVGMAPERFFYANAQNEIVAHDWHEDAVYPIASRPLPMLERMLRRLEAGERPEREPRGPAQVVKLAGRVGAELAADLGLRPVACATDDVVLSWEHEARGTWLSQQGDFTWLETTDDRALALARQRAKESRPPVRP